MTGKVAIIATLDTKGVEVAYLRDRLNQLGVETVVMDTGILGEPVGIIPDISHADLAEHGGITLHELQNSGSRGKAVERMRKFVSSKLWQLWSAGEISGGITVGGVGSVMGAAAIAQLPFGVPKIVVAPTASGRHEFGPYVLRADMMVVHSVVDILGLNEIATTMFENVAAAMKGMLEHGSVLGSPDSSKKRVGVTMLGNTTKAVEALKERLEEHGFEPVIFHSSGIGGLAMEDLAEAGQLVGVIDYTTNEIGDHLTGGIHDAGPERLTRIGKLGLPQVVLPGCVDFSVFAAGSIPEKFSDRPVYDHNPEYTLMRASREDMLEIAKDFANRLNQGTGPVEVLLPTAGLSIPNTPEGPFWDPEADAQFRKTVQENLKAGIAVEEIELHINDPELGKIAADKFVALYKAKEAQS